MDNFIDLMAIAGSFLRDLLKNHWGSLLAFFCGLTPTIWMWLRSRNLLQQGGIAKDDVAIHMLYTRADNGERRLRVATILQTSLRKLYPDNKFVGYLLNKYCGGKNGPFLDLHDPKRQATVYNPILQAISATFAQGNLIAAANCGPIVDVSFIFGLVLIPGGRQRQYRVLVVEEKALQLMQELENDRDLTVPSYLKFLTPILSEMSRRYAAETNRDGLITLGRLEVPCPDFRLLTQK